LRSLAQETKRHRAEIIVVDNASQDGSPEAVENEFPHANVLRNKTNLGFAKANNLGIAQSRGRYLFLINSDIKVLPGCISIMVDYMDTHPAIGMLGPKVLNSDLTLQPSCRRFPNYWNLLGRALGLDSIFPRITFYPHDAIRRVEVLSGCFWMVRKEALKQVGPLDENFFMYAEDVDWCKRFAQAGWQAVYFPDARVIHHGGASSAHEPVRFYLEMQRANLQYWKKHHSRPAQFGFLLISSLRHAIRIFHGMLFYLLKPAAKPEMRLKMTRSLACVGWLLNFHTEKTPLISR
jgi:GT2 family glycosyltransferase